jgi:ATP-dependent protease ClpP protease subunit
MQGDITLRINSPGGDVFAARTMAQAMREYDGAINVIVDGLAASAASIIAVSASNVRMAPGSMMMIHKAWSIAMGNSDDFMDVAGLVEKIDGTIADTYAAKGKGDKDRYAELMAAETWFTAEEAVEEGLADEAIADGPKAKSSWDLSAFDNAPAPQADADPSAAIRARRLSVALV